MGRITAYFGVSTCRRSAPSRQASDQTDVQAQNAQRTRPRPRYSGAFAVGRDHLSATIHNDPLEAPAACGHGDRRLRSDGMRGRQPFDDEGKSSAGRTGPASPSDRAWSALSLSARQPECRPSSSSGSTTLRALTSSPLWRSSGGLRKPVRRRRPCRHRRRGAGRPRRGLRDGGPMFVSGTHTRADRSHRGEQRKQAYPRPVQRALGVAPHAHARASISIAAGKQSVRIRRRQTDSGRSPAGPATAPRRDRDRSSRVRPAAQPLPVSARALTRR